MKLPAHTAGLLLGTACFAMAIEAHAEMALPAMHGPVTDLSGTLSSTEREHIASELRRYESVTSNEIAVLLVRSTDGADRAEEAARTAAC